MRGFLLNMQFLCPCLYVAELLPNNLSEPRIIDGTAQVPFRTQLHWQWAST